MNKEDLSYKLFDKILQSSSKYGLRFSILVISVISATVLVWPGAIIEIVDDNDKLYVALLIYVFAIFLFYLLYDATKRYFQPITVPRKPKVCVFIPANNKSARGDALLQVAGFEAAKLKYNNLDIEQLDSSKPDWMHKLEDMIFNTKPNEPIWIIITMSKYGAEARELIESYTKKDERLRERLTVIFTVTSSRFETTDRKNLFRIFVDGEKEISAIYEFIKLTKDIDSLDEIICYKNNSNYGEDAYKKLSSLLPGSINLTPCNKDNISEALEQSTAKIVIAIAYDEDLIVLFDTLYKNEFVGTLIGTTPMSVPDWQKLFLINKNMLDVYHTAVSGYEDDPEFEERLRPINFQYITDSNKVGTPIFDSNTIREMALDDAYESYSEIENNYVSAFCEDCIRLINMATKKGHPTLYKLLNDPSCDEERRGLTLLRDLDFGVTGDAHVDVYIKKLK
ncbi:MAG: hypothetical protein R8G33_03465 [Gammaproteobacteria bacterium]|nr:hypothetical protein [Gammaproteobacteria bacterium]